MLTHIYVMSDRETIKECRRKCTYMICADGSSTHVLDSRTLTCTKHKAVISTIADALDRFIRPAEVLIHSDDAWVLNMIMRNLPIWAAAGYKCINGDDIKDRDTWQRIHDAGQKITISVKPEKYSNIKQFINSAGQGQNRSFADKH